MDIAAISKLYAIDGPFVSVYLDTPSNLPNAAPRLDTRWKSLVQELTEAGVDQATIEAMASARGEHGLGNTRVIVAAHGKVHLATSSPQPPATEEVVVSSLPRLIPLVDAITMQIPHLVVLADRTGADVLAYTAGPEPEETESVETRRFPHRKVHGMGWATKRWDNDVEETWELSARDVAELIDRVSRDINARLVIASGDDRALQLISQHLPTGLVDKFVKIAGGGRAVDGSDDVIAEEVLRVISDRVAADTIDLLEKFSEERGQSDRASDGVAATIEALRKSQVETLIFTDAREAEATAFVGPDPTHLALAAGELNDMGVDTAVEAPLEEALLRAALGTGADVRFVGGGLEQSPREGVGALLRYAD